MKWVSLHSKSLLIDTRDVQPRQDAWDWGSCLQARAVHEFLFDPDLTGPSCFLALLLAKQNTHGRRVVWVDPLRTFYPPAAQTPLRKLCVVRPRREDTVWTAIECLRCRQIGAVVAPILSGPTRVEVRRLQLAAEQGGGIGLIFRPNSVSAGVHIYAAATRWLVSPAPGERTIQRWRIELIHGHGGHTGQSFILEKNRATGQANFVLVPSALADHAKRAAAS